MGKYYQRIVYPAYYYYDSMPVHPPVYYWFMSQLYKVGLPVFYVIKLPVFLSLAFFVFCLLYSSLGFTSKFSGLLAVVVALDRTGAFITFRPDIVLSINFVTAIICLYNGTQAQVRKRWLITGSILIGVTSTMHYFGIAGCIGLVFFGYKLWQREKSERQKKIQAAIFFPAFFIVWYYLLFLILPNAREIYGEIANATFHTSRSAVQVHYDMYKQIFAGDPLWYPLVLMPGVCWLLVAAYLNRHMRVVYLAAVPFVLFVFVVPAGKSAGYYIVEWFFLFWILYDGLLSLIQLIADKIFIRASRWVMVPVLLFVIDYTVHAFQIDRHVGEVNADAIANGCEMETARACGKRILGSNAKVGGRLNLWYSTGAAHWYQITREMRKNEASEPGYFKNIFSAFDAIAESRQGGDVCYAYKNYSLPQAYTDSTLYLKGFYLSNNYKTVPYNNDNDAPWLLFSIIKPDTVLGYKVYNNENITQYVSDTVLGSNYFLSVVMPETALPMPAFDSLFEMYTKFVFLNVSGDGYKALVWGVTKKTDYSIVLSRIPTNAILRDIIPLKGKEVSKETLLNYKDTPIRFYTGISEIENGESYYPQ